MAFLKKKNGLNYNGDTRSATESDFNLYDGDKISYRQTNENDYRFAPNNSVNLSNTWGKIRREVSGGKGEYTDENPNYVINGNVKNKIDWYNNYRDVADSGMAALGTETNTNRKKVKLLGSRLFGNGTGTTLFS